MRYYIIELTTKDNTHHYEWFKDLDKANEFINSFGEDIELLYINDRQII